MVFGVKYLNYPKDALILILPYNIVPFTPLHVGPSLLTGTVWFNRTNLPALFIGSVIIDIEPIAVLLFNLEYPLHGYLHTYLGATLMGLIIWGVIISNHPSINNIMKLFSLQQESSKISILFSSFIGTYSHILLDSFLYSEMNPFFPILGNPFLLFLSTPFIYGFCLFCFIPAVFLLFFRISRNENQDRIESL